MKFNPLDYFVLAILLLSVIQGFRKGLIDSLGGIVGTVGALLIAYLFRENAARYLENVFGLLNILPAAIEKHVPIPVLGGNQPGVFSPINTLIHSQYVNVAHLIMVSLCFLLLFAVSSVLIKVFFKVLNGLVNWGLLGSVNRLAGIGIVLAKNIIIIAVMLGVFAPLMEKGANVGIKGLLAGNTLMGGSILAPYLLDVFVALEKLVGIAV